MPEAVTDQPLNCFPKSHSRLFSFLFSGQVVKNHSLMWEQAGAIAQLISCADWNLLDCLDLNRKQHTNNTYLPLTDIIGKQRIKSKL